MTTACTLLPGSGFGSMPVGSMPFGTSVPEGIVIVSGEAVSQNEVCVTLSGELPPGAASCSCSSAGSTLNPLSWEVEVIDPPGLPPPFVQYVEAVGDRLCVYFDVVMCCGATYRLTLNDGVTFASPCNQIVFTGFCADPTADPDSMGAQDNFIRDIANPFLLRDVIQTDFAALGTYEITSRGDLAQDGGVASLRKRIFRRIVTLSGEFFHLPTYGSDLEVKRLLKPDLLRRYQEKLRAQINREPEVANCSVRVSQVLNNPNILSVFVRAVTASGAPVELTAPITLP